jgi:hypothetical protein
MMRQTSVLIDQVGNIWSINNWKPDFDIDITVNPGGDGIINLRRTRATASSGPLKSSARAGGRLRTGEERVHSAVSESAQPLP